MLKVEAVAAEITVFGTTEGVRSDSPQLGTRLDNARFVWQDGDPITQFSPANWVLGGPTGFFNYSVAPGQIGFPISLTPLTGFPPGAVLPARDVTIQPGRASYYSQFFNISKLAGYPGELLNPKTGQVTLGAEREIGNRWFLSVDGVHARTTDIERNMDLNAPSLFVRTTPGQTRAATAAATPAAATTRGLRGSTVRPLLSVRGLSKHYGPRLVLDAVRFTIRPGEILGLIGPNGAGKTTLFECLAGMLPSDAGDVQADRRSLLFYVPDGIGPWPDQSVENVLRSFRDLWGLDGLDHRQTLEATAVLRGEAARGRARRRNRSQARPASARLAVKAGVLLAGWFAAWIPAFLALALIDIGSAGA